METFQLLVSAGQVLPLRPCMKWEDGDVAFEGWVAPCDESRVRHIPEVVRKRVLQNLQFFKLVLSMVMKIGCRPLE